MRKRGFILCVVMSCFCSVFGACTSKTVDAYTVYNEFVKGIYSDTEPDREPERFRYGLALIDDDDLPELFVSCGDYHAAGVRVYFYDPKEKQVLEVTGDKKLFGENGGFSYYERKSCIYDYHFSGGTAYSSFCRIENSGGGHKVKQSSIFTLRNEEEIYYFVGSNEVSREVYENAFDLEASEFADLQQTSVHYDDMRGTYETAFGDDWLNVFQNMYKDLMGEDGIK